MTASSSSNHDSQREAGAGLRMLPVSDNLMDELRRELPRLTDAVLDEPELAREFEILSRIRPKAVLQVLNETDRLLAETNSAIAKLRIAYSSLEHYEATKAVTGVDADAPRERLPPGSSVLAIGLSVSALTPVFAWRAWQYLTGYLGGFLGSLICAVILLLGIGLCASSFWMVKRAYDRDRSFGSLGAFLGAGVSESVIVALWIWRMLIPTYRAVGFFAWIIWAVIVVIALILLAVDIARIGDQLGRPDISNVCFALLRRTNRLLISTVLIGITVGLTVASFTTVSQREAASLAAITALLIPLSRATLVPLVLNAYERLRKGMFRSQLQQAGPITEGQRLALNFKEAKDAWEDSVKITIRDYLKMWLAQISKPPFSVELNIVSSGGLLQMRAHDSVVATKGVFGRFEEAIGQIGGGAIGIAGPQGVGKSTLLEAYRDGRFIGAGREHLVVFESVPVRYDPRDFALHLYAALCKAVIEFAGQHPSSEATTWMRYLRGLLRYAPPPSWVLAWLAVSYLGLVVVQDQSSSRPGFSTFSWLVIIVLAGVVLLLLNSRNAREGQLEKLPLDVVTDLVALRAVARSKLDGIQFQQRHTTGWSGNLTSGLGLSGSRSVSLERTRQAMSYPELVRDFRDFLTTTVRIMESIPTAAEMTPVAIIIDELDKVQIPDQAQEFVNEVKALFGIDVPGCIFLISVSDEALASFERRGLPLRAAFESTFDVIFRVEPLELSDTRAVLCNRVVGLSDPFVCLCHSFSGGLPREAIRRARGVVGCRKKTLAEVANRLVSEDMNIKEAALRTLISQQLEAEPYSSKLIQYLDGYRSSEVGVLLASLQNPPIKKIDLVGAGNAIQDVFQLQLEAFAYRYFCATVLAVFSNDMTQQSLERGLGQDEPSNFNRLADARRLLEINARVAWLTVTSFRRPWQLEVIEVPW